LLDVAGILIAESIECIA